MKVQAQAFHKLQAAELTASRVKPLHSTDITSLVHTLRTGAHASIP